MDRQPAGEVTRDARAAQRGPLFLPTTALRQVGSLLVVRHRTRQPTNDDFEVMLAAVEDPSVRAILVDGGKDGTLSVLQRHRIAAALKAKRIRIALLTESRLSLGVLTAISWVVPHIKGFGPGDVVDAMAFLDVDEPTPLVEDVLHSLRMTAPPPITPSDL